jgi:hypothetical protein
LVSLIRRVIICELALKRKGSVLDKELSLTLSFVFIEAAFIDDVDIRGIILADVTGGCLSQRS